MAREGRAPATPATELGRIIQAAMQERERERGQTYGVRELAADTGLSFAYLARIVRGEREPSREVVVSVAAALSPLAAVDDLLLAAGLAPDSPALLRLARRLAGLGAAQIAQIEAAIGELVSEPAAPASARQSAGDKRTGGESGHAATARTPDREAEGA